MTDPNFISRQAAVLTTVKGTTYDQVVALSQGMINVWIANFYEVNPQLYALHFSGSALPSLVSAPVPFVFLSSVRSQCRHH